MRIAAIVLVAQGFVACAGAPPTSTSSAVAEPLPSLTLPLLDGGTWSSSSARGSALVIDVWASWCKPCSKGFPALNALAARRADVGVVAISLDEDVAAARDFIAQFPLTVVIAHDRQHMLTRAPLSIARLPTVLVVDAAGVIRHRIEEPRERDYERLEELIAALPSPKLSRRQAGPPLERAIERALLGEPAQICDVDERQRRVGDVGQCQLAARVVDDLAEARAAVGEPSLEHARR